MSAWPTLNCFLKKMGGGEKSVIYFWNGQWWSICFVWVFKMWRPSVKRKKIVPENVLKKFAPLKILCPPGKVLPPHKS